MGRTTPTPADVGGATAAAVAESHKLAAERKCTDAVNKAYAWIDRHPSVVEAGAELFAAQAITLRRVPADVVAAGGGAAGGRVQGAEPFAAALNELHEHWAGHVAQERERREKAVQALLQNPARPWLPRMRELRDKAYRAAELAVDLLNKKKG